MTRRASCPLSRQRASARSRPACRRAAISMSDLAYEYVQTPAELERIIRDALRQQDG